MARPQFRLTRCLTEGSDDVKADYFEVVEMSGELAIADQPPLKLIKPF